MSGVSDFCIQAVQRRSGRMLLMFVVFAMLAPAGIAETPEAEPEVSSSELGSAAYLPQDVAVFSSARDVLPRLRAIRNSRAVETLLTLPAVQELFSGLPATEEIQAQADEQVPGLWALLEDGLSEEIFVTIGGEAVPFARALAEIMRETQAQQIQMISDSQPQPEDQVRAIASFIRVVMANSKDLHLPPVLLGFKVSNAANANATMERLLEMIPPSPRIKRSHREIGGSTFMVLDTGFAGMEEDIIDGLTEAGVDPSQASRFAQFLASRPLRIAVGVRDGYLLISLAEDDGLLLRWGQEASLAASDAFSPLRERLKPGLMNVQYRSAEFEGLIAWHPDDLQHSIDVVKLIPPEEFPPEVRDRIVADLQGLGQALPEERVREALSFSFANRGIERWSFDSDITDVGENGELEILAHRGINPIAFHASTGVSSRERYDLLAMVVGKLDWYIEHQVLKNLDPEMQYDMRPAYAMTRTFLGDIHAAIDKNILPSTAGTDAINVIDWQGIVQVPGPQPEQVLEIPIPRVGTGMGLNDAQQYRRGISQGYAAVNRLLQTASQTWPENLPPDLALPEVLSQPLGDGEAFWLNLPPMLGMDVYPTAWLNESMTLAATSQNYVNELMQPQPLPLTSDVIQLNAPSQSVTVVDFPQLWQALEVLSTNLPAYTGQAPMAFEVRNYSLRCLRALRAFRAYQARTFVQEGRRVRHSWLHIEDIE